MTPPPTDAARRALAPIAGWRDRAGQDPRHDERTAALLGIALGTCFVVCFATGLYAQFSQHPPSWFQLPAAPAGLFRITQGVHVATGIAAVPLLLAKLWAVFPRLLAWPPVTGIAHAVERLALLPLVGGALFMLFSGVANIDLWYPLPFFFPTAHYWMAWVTIGALVVHMGAKLPVTRSALATGAAHKPAGAARPTDGPGADQPEVDTPGTDRGDADLVDTGGRRRFLTAVGAAAGLLTLTTVGQTVAPLQRLALLAPRHPDLGTQGFPVNKTASEAGVAEQAQRADHTLSVTGAVAHPLTLGLDDLRSLGLHEAVLPIACVEGWSASRRWRGVRMADLLELAGAPAGRKVFVTGLETGGLYGQSLVDADQARASNTLLALEVDGEALALDHGFPLRLIGPNRPGVMQTKWVTGLEVL